MSTRTNKPLKDQPVPAVDNGMADHTTTRDLSRWIGMFCLYNGPDPFNTMAAAPERQALAAWLESHGLRHGDIRRHENGGCWICGQTNYNHYVIAARFNDENILDREPVEVIEVGHTCAEQLGMTGLERKYERAANRARTEAHAAEFATHHNLDKVAAMLDAGRLNPWGADIAADIFDYIRRKGAASDKQVALLHRIHDETVERERATAEMIERGELVPAPTGRTVVTGTVIKTRREQGYGYHDPDVMKITVIADGDGGSFKCHGTAPRSIARVDGDTPADDIDLAAGDRVEFTATLTPKDNDPTFAFWKRPTKARVVERAAE